METQQKYKSQDALMERLLTKAQQKPKREIPEDKVKNDIRNWLNEKIEEGSHLTHFPYSSFRGTPGVADRIVCYESIFIAIESKRPSRKTHKNGGLSDNQRLFGEDVRLARGHYIVAYSVDDVKKYFKEHFGLS